MGKGATAAAAKQDAADKVKFAQNFSSRVMKRISSAIKEKSVNSIIQKSANNA